MKLRLPFAPLVALRFLREGRMQTLLIIVGDEGAAYHMIDNQTQTRRYSGLRARLCGECGAI